MMLSPSAVRSSAQTRRRARPVVLSPPLMFTFTFPCQYTVVVAVKPHLQGAKLAWQPLGKYLPVVFTLFNE